MPNRKAKHRKQIKHEKDKQLRKEGRTKIQYKKWLKKQSKKQIGKKMK